MKLDITKIPGYEAGMDSDALLKLIREHDIDLSGYVKKDVADRYASEAADYKKKYNATLGDQERKSAEDAERLKAMEDELNSLRRERAISKYTADRQVFMEERGNGGLPAQGEDFDYRISEAEERRAPRTAAVRRRTHGALKKKNGSFGKKPEGGNAADRPRGFPRHEPSCIMEVYCKEVWN